MLNTAGEVGTSSLVMNSYGPLHMAKQKQGNQLEPSYSSSVRIRSVALRTCRKWWMIGRGGERGSGISVLMAPQDDDDDTITTINPWSQCLGQRWKNIQTKSFKTVQSKFRWKFNVTIILRRAKFIDGYTNFKPRGQ